MLRSGQYSSQTLRRLDEEIMSTTIVVFAGGQAKRMGYPNLPKALAPINDETLLDCCIWFYRDSGFRNFVFILGYLHEQIEEYIGDGRRFGIDVRYSLDPEIPSGVGRGKALKHAINRGAVSRDRRIITAYPDDVFLDKMLSVNLMSHHLTLVELKHVLATSVLVSGTRYPYGAAKLDEDLIVGFEEKPFVKIPTSTGLSVLEPGCFEVLDRVVDMNLPYPLELENTLYPVLAEERKMGYYMHNSSEIWMPVNTVKELEEVAKRIKLKSR
ncbi:NTP transferase domain-containing protein [archaeon]|nr:NTP transferase domain-containing protein [archaeon]